MDARIIPFPTRALDGPGPALAVGSSLPQVDVEPVGEAFAEVVIGFRSLADEDGPGLSSCVLAAAESIATEGGHVRLEGTGAHPVVIGEFVGTEAPMRAVAAVLDADQEVRAAGDRRFVIGAGVAEGRRIPVAASVVRRVGASSARRGAEKAAPGQVLLVGASWERHRRVAAVPGQALASQPVFVLRGLR